MTALAVLGASCLAAWVSDDLRILPAPNLDRGLKVYDRYNKPVCTILDQDRFLHEVPISQISLPMQQAVLAAEDRSFYQHHGLDPAGVVRAGLANLKAGHVVQGGSTITQQLAKVTFFRDSERSVLQKLRETAMAYMLESRYSKDKLLESYLNTVYFGRGVYGVDRASWKYFSKPAANLSLAESAYLAALINAPTILSVPNNNPQAVARQAHILHTMAEMNLISSQDAQFAIKQKLKFKSGTDTTQRCAYYLSTVNDFVKGSWGDRAIYRGYQVHTFLDPQAQQAADITLRTGINKAPAGINQGALVSLSVKDGTVLAMVGGATGFDASQYNRATSPHTAGSAFKPFVYLAGLMTGVVKPDSLVLDAPFQDDYGQLAAYNPKNFDSQYMGQITVRKAIALSRNTCAVRVAQMSGPQNVVEVARRAGIDSKMDATPSIGLGSCAVSPLDMASAYGTLARGGVVIAPRMIAKIEDSHGNLIKDFPAPEAKRMFESEPVAQLVDALQDVVERGTGTRARLFGRPVAGKTGTSDGARDIWFVGFTPDTVTAVWGGNDHNKSVYGAHVTGGSIMAGIWQRYMISYYKGHTKVPAGTFVAPHEPLIEEPDSIYFLPQPARIFDSLLNVFRPESRDWRFSGSSDRNEARYEQEREREQMEPVAQEDLDARLSEDPPPMKPKHKSKWKKFLGKLVNAL